MLSCLPFAVQWAGQLGDGRAISLGQAVGPDGTAYELQLKVCSSSPYQSYMRHTAPPCLLLHTP